MKKNRFIIAVVLILLCVAVFLLLKSRPGTYSRGSEDFAVSDTSNITKIFFSDKKNRNITLTRVNEGMWRVNDKFMAREEGIGIMLKTLLNLSVKAPVPLTARNNVIRRLAAKSVKVEIYQRVYRIDLFGRIQLFPHEKLTKTYFVGDVAQDNIGTFMIMKGSDEPFVTYLPGFRGFVSSRYSTLEEDWREHIIFHHRLPDIANLSMAFGDKPEWSFSIDNPDNRGFKLNAGIGGRPVTDYDTAKVIEFLGSFANVRFESFLNDVDKAKRDSITSSRPYYQISLTDRLGKTFTVTTFRKLPPGGQVDMHGNPVTYDRERMYALVNDNKDLVFVQFFVFDHIMKPLPYFLKGGNTGSDQSKNPE
jgi:hypothetical protein